MPQKHTHTYILHHVRDTKRHIHIHNPHNSQSTHRRHKHTPIHLGYGPQPIPATNSVSSRQPHHRQLHVSNNPSCLSSSSKLFPEGRGIQQGLSSLTTDAVPRLLTVRPLVPLLLSYAELSQFRWGRTCPDPASAPLACIQALPLTETARESLAWPCSYSAHLADVSVRQELRRSRTSAWHKSPRCLGLGPMTSCHDRGNL